jgi:hypothetical protein
LALLAALYLPNLNHGFVWSDAAEIEYGTLIRAPGEWSQAFSQPLHANLTGSRAAQTQPYYRPLQVVLVSWIDHTLGRSPAAFRSFALLFAAITVVLFGLLLRQLDVPTTGVLFAMSWLAVHPAGLECWVWVSGISEAMMAAALLASLLLGALHFRARGRAARCGLAAASFLALLLGLLSKEKAAIGPGLLLLLGWCLRVSWRSGVILVVAQLALVVAHFAGWRAHVLQGSFSATGPDGGQWSTHLASVLAFWPQMLGWLFVPLHCNTSDVIGICSTFVDAGTLLGITLVLASVALAWWSFQRGHRLITLGLLWVWMAFLPTSHLVPMLHARAERYLCFSVPGAALLLLGVWQLLQPRIRRIPRAGVVLGVAIVMLVGTRTATRAGDWISTEVLFSRDVAADPRFREGRFYLARLAFERGEFQQAHEHLSKLVALERGPQEHRGYLRREDCFQLYCVNLFNMGRHQEILSFLQGVFQEEPELRTNPSLLLSYAHGLSGAGRPREALRIYQALADQLPGEPDTDLCLALARCHVKLGHKKEAATWLQRIPAQGRSPMLQQEIQRLWQLTR